MGKASIYAYLKKNTDFTDCGIIGLMANIQAESNFKASNLQNTGNRKLGMTDEEYTAAVDNGSYSRDMFRGDSQGFGLVQWTWHSRKAGLYDNAKKKKKSIGDEEMQLEFMLSELNGYKEVIEVLRTAKTVKEASDIVMLRYEQPADQSEKAKAKRAAYGEALYEEFCTKEQPAEKPKEPASAAVKVDYARSYNKSYSRAFTTTSDLNLRAGAGMGKKIITVLPKGTKVRCWGYYTVNENIIWLLVQYKGYTGFCSKYYLK